MQSLRLDPAWAEGVVSWEQGDGWLKPWRLPFERLPLYSPFGELHNRAEWPAGVRLRVKTNATAFGLELEPEAQNRQFDLVSGGEVTTQVLPHGETELIFAGLPGEAQVVELWLPQADFVRIRQVLINDGATVETLADQRPKWITYGSSISHCRTADSPATTWPALVARGRDLNLTCLGYGGNCHLESMVAKLIRDLPADFISLKLGINIYGGATLSPRTFQAAAIGFIDRIREGHPETPLAVVSPIYSPARETAKNAVGFTLQMMREHLASVVDTLRSFGDQNLWYFDGLELLGADQADLLPDDLHPNGEGYRLMAENFQRLVMGTISVG